MQRVSFKVGVAFFDGQINRAIRRRLATGKIQLESDTGELENLTDAELRSRWLSQEWTINEESLGCLDVVIPESALAELRAASAIELGFPHEFLSTDNVRELIYGGLYKQIIQ